MKSVVFFLLCLFSQVSAYELGPLCDADYHFLQYRCIQIESAVSNIEKSINEIHMSYEERRALNHELDVIKFNLGISEFK